MKVNEKQKKSKRKAKEKQQHSDRKVKTTKRNVQHPQRKNRKKQSTLRLDVRPQPPTRPPIELCSPYRCTYVYRKRCTNIGVYLFVSFLFLLCSVLLYWVSPHLIIVNPWKFDHFSCFLRPLLRKFWAKRGGGFISGLHQHGGFKVSQNTGWRTHHPVLNRD